MYVRISLLFLVLLGITGSAAAGMRKCNKRPTKSPYLLSLVQLPAQKEQQQDQGSPENAICLTVSPLTIKEDKEEPPVYSSRRQQPMSRELSFCPQDYSNPPFAPPRS